MQPHTSQERETRLASNQAGLTQKPHREAGLRWRVTLQQIHITVSRQASDLSALGFLGEMLYPVLAEPRKGASTLQKLGLTVTIQIRAKVGMGWIRAAVQITISLP